MEFVYIGKGDRDLTYKIGHTTRPEEEREKQHQSSNPSFKFYRLFRTEAARNLETKLHNFFCSKRVRGTKEWFELDPDDLYAARLLAETYEHEMLPRSKELVDLSKTRSSKSYIDVSGSLEADYLRLRENCDRTRLELNRSLNCSNSS